MYYVVGTYSYVAYLLYRICDVRSARRRRRTIVQPCTYSRSLALKEIRLELYVVRVFRFGVLRVLFSLTKRTVVLAISITE